LVARLFVYGTLRSGNRPFDEFLSESALYVEPATLRDHALYGAGLAYPYVAVARGYTVVGEVVTVAASGWPDLTAVLDEYEGPEYSRVQVVVETFGSQVTANTYRALPHIDLDPASRIDSADWMDMQP